MRKEITPFSFSAGERKIMAHFVVSKYFVSCVSITEPRRKICAPCQNFQL